MLTSCHCGLVSEGSKCCRCWAVCVYLAGQVCLDMYMLIGINDPDMRGGDLGCMYALLVSGAGRVSVSWYLLIGSIPNASEMQGDMDLRSIVPNDMEAGHHRPTQIIAERPARFFMFIDLKTFIALDRKSTWRSRICLLKRQTRKPW
jgi:hypothetical protein